MTSDADDYSSGEIVRALRRIESEIAGIKVDISNLNFVRQDVWHAEHALLVARIDNVQAEAEKDREELRTDIGGIRDSNQWLWRTVVAAVIVAVVGLIVTGYAPS